ncbi:MAG: ABC transporter ATP-binding protein [Acidobacteria bacterium]|nr:ABC transporter ATP-binding protein [Acidobacteriota bacterium]
MAPNALLEIRHLSVSYFSTPGFLPAVRDISLQVHKEETHALAGETGSGKSTIALAATGLLDPRAKIESGEILYRGRDLRSLRGGDWKEMRGREIAQIFQDARSALNPVLTIEDHLIETLQSHQRRANKEAKARALDLLQEVGIPGGHEKLYPFELSGGICQRVGIALAICNNPHLLIADEPTSSLDSTIQAQILELLLLMKRRHGLALMLISHDLALISQVADRISILYHGRIVESGSKEEIFSSPAHPYTQSLMQCIVGLQHHSEMRPIASISGSVPVPGRQFSGCAFAQRCGIALPECQRTVPARRELSNTHWVACICSNINQGARDGQNRKRNGIEG